MKTIEDISKKIDEVQTSIETTEGLLAQLLDKQKEIPKKEKDKNDNIGIDEKTLNNLTQRFERTLSNKLGNENVFTILEGYKLHFERFLINHLQPAKNITVFGGKDALVNYNRILIGSGIVIIIYTVFKFLPSYLIEKQKLDDEYLVYKTYAETHLLLEFFNNGTTKDYDELINSIKNQSPEFKNQFKRLVEYWNEEHEKATLKMQIQQNQQRLKELEK